MHVQFARLLECLSRYHLSCQLSLVLVVVAASGKAQESSLPTVGIAREYPGDQGIGDDPRVVFAENFEHASLDEMAARWETVRDQPIMSLTSDVPAHSSGKRSLLMSQRAELGTGADLYRRLDEGYDRLYSRMYVKFAEDCEPVHHFGTCVGGNNPSTPWPSVRAGQPTDGERSFWVGVEPFGEEWRWDYYAYWCEMRGSPPRGQTWGNSFIRDDAYRVERGRWTCIELMVKVNTIGQSDGELALWLDGRPVSHLGPGFPRGKWIFDKFYPSQEGAGVRWNPATDRREEFVTAAGGDPFEGFRFRTAEKLKINFLWLYLYLTEGTEGHVNRVWFDDVVVAKEYIGPLQSVE